MRNQTFGQTNIVKLGDKDATVSVLERVQVYMARAKGGSPEEIFRNFLARYAPRKVVLNPVLS